MQLPGDELFFADVHLHGGPARVRRFLPELIDLICNRQVDPGKVFDLTLPLDQAAVLDDALRVPVDPTALAQLASMTGGTAYTAASGAELEDVYADIGSSIGYRTEERDITAWVLAGALLAAAAAAVTSLRWFARLP